MSLATSSHHQCGRRGLRAHLCCSEYAAVSLQHDRMRQGQPEWIMGGCIPVWGGVGPVCQACKHSATVERPYSHSFVPSESSCLLSGRLSSSTNLGDLVHANGDVDMLRTQLRLAQLGSLRCSAAPGEENPVLSAVGATSSSGWGADPGESFLSPELSCRALQPKMTASVYGV